MSTNPSDPTDVSAEIAHIRGLTLETSKAVMQGGGDSILFDPQLTAAAVISYAVEVEALRKEILGYKVADGLSKEKIEQLEHRIETQADLIYTYESGG